MFYLVLPASPSSPTNRIETNSSIVVVGANGSGKTRLGSWIDLQSEHRNIVHRVGAQKSLTMPSVSTSMSVDEAESNLIYGYTVRNADYKIGHRWGSNPNTYLLNDFDRLMIYLFSEENDQNAKYKQAARQIDVRLEPPETKLDKIARIWQESLPHRKLLIGGGKIQTAVASNPNAIYNAAEMSDGERVIFYLIGQALSAPRDGIILIDEPELHLHKSVQSTLWDKIEAERPDCLFVYLTHDLDFAASRVTATKVCVRNFDGQTWDWYVVPENDEVPEEIMLEILGSRKPVIFVEGERSSIDYFLFQRLYPEFTIIPAGGCSTVIHATRSFSALNNLHRLNSYGIIDRDFRDEDEVRYLQNIGVFVLSVSELENVLLSEDVLRVVADNLHRDDFPTLFSGVKRIVFGEMARNKEQLVSAITASKIERKLGNYDAKAIGPSNLQASLEETLKSIDVTALYNSTLAVVENTLASENYTEAIKIYSNKGLIHQIGALFGFRSNEFADFVKRLTASKDGDKLLLAMKAQVPTITNL